MGLEQNTCTIQLVKSLDMQCSLRGTYPFYKGQLYKKLLLGEK